MRQIDARLKLSERLAACLTDKRDPSKTQHSLKDLIQTRIFLIGQGYEDCDDADFLREDPMFKTALGRSPETGTGLPSQPTLSRFEQGLILEHGLRYRDLLAMSEIFVNLFVKQCKGKPPKEILLDLDSTDDPTHGQQQMSFFNGFYETHCYIPHYLYAAMDGEAEKHMLAAVLRPGNTHSSHGALSLLSRVIDRLRQAFPKARIRFRADAGFAIPEIYTWFEQQENMVYEIGLPKNNRLLKRGKKLLTKARKEHRKTKEKARLFGEFNYRAKTWKKARRVVMKAEILEKGENPRFVVTNRIDVTPEALYESYVDRGDAENRIKELKLDLHAGRTSCMRFKANQLRLILHAASYVLFQALRRLTEGTELAKAQVGSLRMRLLKIGVLVKESVRRVWVHFSSHFAFQKLFMQLLIQIRGSTS